MKPGFLHRIPRRARLWLLWGAAAFILYTLIGFFLLPPIVKWQLTKQLPAITKRQAAVQQVKVNPWTFSLTVRGLALTEPDGRPFASWDELYVNFQASSLFRWAWTFKEIRLVKPFGELILLKNGQLNIANILEGLETSNAPPSVPRVNIFYLEVTNGFVALEDQTRRLVFRTEYRPINLHLREFTTQPHSDTPYAFRAESDAGRSVTWAGDFTVQPLRSSGHLEVTAVQLPRYRPYLEDFTRAVPTNGLADVQFDYRFSADTNGLGLVVTNASLQVSQVQALDPDTGEVVASLRGLEVAGAWFNLLERAARVGTVKVSEAALLARLKRDGRLNLLDLIVMPPTPTNAPPTADFGLGDLPLTIAVDELTVERTAVTFEDLTRRTPFKTELKPIEVKVKGFSTRPETDATYSFQVGSEAAETFEGAGSFSINPLRSVGEIKVGAVDVKKYLPYAEDFFRGNIVAGKVEARAPYRVAMDSSGLRAGVTNLAVKLSALEVLMPETAEKVTQIKEIGFERVDASLEDRRGRVGLFKGDGGSVLARRQKDGRINLLGLLAVSKANVTSAGPEPAATGGGGGTNSSVFALGSWTLNVDEIQLDNYNLKIEDLVPPKPAVFQVDQLAVNLKGLSTITNTPISTRVAFRLNETATVAAQGTAKLAPLFANLDVAVTNLELRAAQPYLDQFVALGIVSGGLTTAGKVQFQTNDAAAPMLTFAGGVRLTNFVTADQVLFKEFVRWDDLAIEGIDATLVPNRFKIGEIRLTRPKASLLLGPDRQPNLSLILRADGTATNVAAVSPAAMTSSTNSLLDSFPIEVGSLVLDHASLAFADESVQPAVTLGVEELSGTIKGLSSATNSSAEVDLAGKVDAQSPFSIRGRVNPFPAARQADLIITNANTQLTPLTGYMEKYGGYPLRKGQVSTSLRYRIEGNALQAENLIHVDQLTLGTRNDSPDATKLPVKLGVALLKDNNGRIELDVPIKGTIDDPQFSLGPVILKVVSDLVVKAATSPFKLLGALVGGGGDELSYVEFAAGSTNPVQGELDKLGKLAAALAKRPALNLEIEGSIHPEQDREAFARLKLDERLKAKRLQELSREGRAPESIATFQLEAADRERLLRTAFVEQFGTNIAQIVQTNLARLAGTNQPASAAAAASPKPDQSLVEWLAAFFKRDNGVWTKETKHLPKEDRRALSLATPQFMEDLLVKEVQVTEEDLRQLVAARARWVQDWLMQHGQVSAERIFLVTPKPIDANYRGERRVNLSLS